ncbi:zinc finger protein 433-like [Cydia fagiglandana]|uniref:zinc finger protein 433-like n=1 Tax=Cydia fagiglandana TaxID=1458189 RepID=UPI002FEE1155
MDITHNADDKSSNEDALLCCRACLSTDGRLYNMYEYKLADAFAHITGTPVVKDRRPQHLCAYCGARLLKCATFREMCLEAQQTLTLVLLKEKLDTQNISRIKPPSTHHLTITNVETTDYIDAPADDIKHEPDIDNIDIVDIDGIIGKTDMKEEVEKTDDKRPVRNRKRKIGTKKNQAIKIKNNDEPEVSLSDTKIKMEIEIERLNYDEYDGVETKKEDIESDDNDDIDDVDSDNDFLIAKTPVKRKAVKKRVALKKEAKKDTKRGGEVKRKRKEGKRKFRDPANDNMPIFDFAKFENAHAVKIVVLTKEEQMEEINLRKKTRNFLESNFRCDDCGRGFDADAAYNNHLLRHSPSEGQYPCEICGMRFKLKCMCQRHQDVHRLKFICNECSYVSRDRYQARRHHAMHTGKTYECQHCGKVFNKSSTYLSHVRMAHPALNAACDVCGETFVGQLGLKLHKSRAHAEWDGCTSLSVTRVAHPALNAACDVCGETFVGQLGLKLHKSRAHAEWDGCTSLSVTRVAHPALNAACDVCGETFVGQLGLKLHKSRAHAEKPQQFKCTRCSVNFISLEALNRHTDTAGEHGALRPCEQCGENCASEQALQEHVIERHPKQTYNCSECGMSFPSAAACELHHKRKHLGQRYTGTKMDRAMRKRYAQKPQPKGVFVCEQCGRVAKNATLLRYHQRSHQEVKPFACNICPKSFPLKTALEEHIRSHTGEKPYQCPECPLAFSLKGNFNRHHKTAHQGLRANVPCSICGRVFSTKAVLRTHVNTVHHGQPWPKRDRTKRPKSGHTTPSSDILALAHTKQ